MSSLDDRELVEQFQHGANREAVFRELIVRYQEKLYWQIRRIVMVHDDADDVLQNTFIKIYDGLDKFRQESQLFTWMFRIATNEALSWQKKAARRMMLPLDHGSARVEGFLESDQFFDGDEAQALLQKAILKLPDRQRIVFNMKYFDNMTYEQMSEILKTSIGALKASYHHAVKKIENFINSR